MPTLQALVVIQQKLISHSTSSTCRHTSTYSRECTNNHSCGSAYNRTYRRSRAHGCQTGYNGTNLRTNFCTCCCSCGYTKISGNTASNPTNSGASLAAIIARIDIAGTTFRTLMGHDKSP